MSTDIYPSVSSLSSIYQWPYLNIPLTELRNHYVDRNGQWIGPLENSKDVESNNSDANSSYENLTRQLRIQIVAEDSKQAYNHSCTPSLATATTPWVAEHRALPQKKFCEESTMNLEQLMDYLSKIPMVQALDDVSAIKYTVDHNIQVRQIRSELNQVLLVRCLPVPPLIDLIMLYVPTYLQVGIDCEKRGDQPNAFRWFDGASKEALTNDPATIGAASYKASQYYSQGLNACRVNDPLVKLLLKRAVCAKVRESYHLYVKIEITAKYSTDNTVNDEQLLLLAQAANTGCMFAIGGVFEHLLCKTVTFSKSVEDWIREFRPELKRLIYEENNMGAAYLLNQLNNQSKYSTKKDVVLYGAIAAFNGHCEAILDLGTLELHSMFLNPRNCDIHVFDDRAFDNEAEGFKWYERAASCEHRTCIFYLALCYKDGRGCQVNQKRVKELLIKVRDHSNDLNDAILLKVNKLLDDIA